jgi:hypothetical protein
MSTPAEVIARCNQIMAHAWMVRTFVKHSEEAEDYPKLYVLARTVFDMARALETRLDDPAGYLRMLRKKLGRLGRAAEAFRGDVAEASEHTNWKQAVVSMDACVAELRELLSAGEAALARSTEVGESKEVESGEEE